MSDNTDSTTPTQVNDVPTFGLNDLVLLLQVIEACAQRGAFKAEELSNVGGCYDRLRVFLVANNVLPTQAAEPAAAPAAEVTSSEGE